MPPGRPPSPDPKTKILSLRLTPQMHVWLEGQAQRAGRSVIDFIRDTLAREYGWYEQYVAPPCPHCAGEADAEARYANPS